MAFLALLGLAGAACGSSGGGPLGETAANVNKVNSGMLDLRLTAATGDQPTGEEAGFRLEGPFAQGAKGHLPVTDMTYTQLLGRDERAVKIVSVDDQAYVVRAGRSYVLGPAETQQLKISGGSDKLDLNLRSWFDKPEVVDAGQRDGVAVQRITGRVKVAPALDDLLRLSRRFGAADQATPPVKGDLGRQLEKSTESSSAEVITGTKDRFLRHLVVDIKLRSQAPEQIRAAFGNLGVVRFHFELSLSQPNGPVHVVPPDHPLPASELPGR